MNIDSLVEMLCCNILDDVMFARSIVYEQLVMKDQIKDLSQLTSKLKKSGVWFKQTDGHYLLVRTLFTDLGYNKLLFYYDYEEMYAKKVINKV